ncbi:hypothetical protein [Rubripirellula lacrimiformis]|uniref:hypothetical protein n=1 Tax=Rubripirellula lacrimiformis TaxID=1930273 RepID=UPI0011AAC734|nr:hypothetical protein [Rubripirellula lacrimiformis]
MPSSTFLVWESIGGSEGQQAQRFGCANAVVLCDTAHLGQRWAACKAAEGSRWRTNRIVHVISERPIKLVFRMVDAIFGRSVTIGRLV